jgi:membrane protease YdiL (CAAX protease family)
VALSASLFGFMHIIYHDLPTILLTLFAGLIWAVVFHATRKVWIVALSHAALGVVAIVAGLV